MCRFVPRLMFPDVSRELVPSFSAREVEVTTFPFETGNSNQSIQRQIPEDLKPLQWMSVLEIKSFGCNSDGQFGLRIVL
jgi:hypothetical protein